MCRNVFLFLLRFYLLERKREHMRTHGVQAQARTVGKRTPRGAGSPTQDLISGPGIMI